MGRCGSADGAFGAIGDCGGSSSAGRAVFPGIQQENEAVEGGDAVGCGRGLRVRSERMSA